VVHESLRCVFSIQDTKLSVDSLVRSLKTHTLFKKIYKLVLESKLLVVLNKIFQVIRKDNNLHGAHVGCSELLSTDACKAHIFPYTRNISFLCSFKSSLVLLKLNQDLCKLLIVSYLGVENLSCLVKFLVKAAVTKLLDVSLIWLADELFEIWEVSLSALGIGEDQLRVYHLFLEKRAGHQEILNEFLIAVLILGCADNQGIF